MTPHIIPPGTLVHLTRPYEEYAYGRLCRVLGHFVMTLGLFKDQVIYGVSAVGVDRHDAWNPGDKGIHRDGRAVGLKGFVIRASELVVCREPDELKGCMGTRCLTEGADFHKFTITEEFGKVWTFTTNVPPTVREDGALILGTDIHLSDSQIIPAGRWKKDLAFNVAGRYI